jgi:hypothetical protein
MRTGRTSGRSRCCRLATAPSSIPVGNPYSSTTGVSSAVVAEVEDPAAASAGPLGSPARLEAHAGHLGEPHSGGDEQADDRVVAAFLESLAGGRLEQRPQLVAGVDGGGFSGIAGGDMPAAVAGEWRLSSLMIHTSTWRRSIASTLVGSPSAVSHQEKRRVASL